MSRATCPARPARGLTIPIHHRSGGPARKAAGVGRVRVVAGPMEAAWRPEVTRRRHPGRRFSAGLSTPNKSALPSKTNSNAIGRQSGAVFCRFQGAMGKEKERLKILSSSARASSESTTLSVMLVEPAASPAGTPAHQRTRPRTRLQGPCTGRDRGAAGTVDAAHPVRRSGNTRDCSRVGAVTLTRSATWSSSSIQRTKIGSRWLHEKGVNRLDARRVLRPSIRMPGRASGRIRPRYW